MSDNYFRETSHHEWILTNGLGGYSLGTGNLINQRRYNSLLTSADKNLNRFKLVSCLEELVEWRGETFYLDSNNYSNCIYPEGFLHLVKSWLRPFPIFLYSSLTHSNRILIKKEIMMSKGSNSVLIKYTNLGFHKIHLELRPKLSLSNHHHLNPKGCWDYEKVYTETGDKSFYIKKESNNTGLFLFISEGEIVSDRVIFSECYYPWEAMRGYDATEDLLSPVKIILDLKPNEKKYLIFSDKNIKKNNRKNLITFIDKIEKDYSNLPLPKDYPQYNSELSPLLERIDYKDSELFDYEGYLKVLDFSLRDFIIEDDVIAGYPWFGCWGRDTMITLNAIQNLPGGLDISWNIIERYAKRIKKSLIPNMLSESGHTENYQSIDAVFWFLIGMYNHYHIESTQSISQKTSSRLKLKLEKILDYYLKILHPFFKDFYSAAIRPSNIKHIKQPFHISKDGLLILDEEFSASTWMDAKVKGQPVTPRHGAPIEINALFYNSLCALEDLLLLYKKTFGSSDPYKLPKYFKKLKEALFKSFELYWVGDFFADRLHDGDPVIEYRPNAVIALSLPFDITSEIRMETAFRKATQLFLTDYGLRTLSDDDYMFQKKYLGSQAERDKQYHQGTVWAWLLDPYLKLYYKIYKNKKQAEELKAEIERIILKFRNGFIRGHISSVAEVWDGSHPHFPKGCPAQAWSVAAIYNAETLIKSIMKEV